MAFLSISILMAFAGVVRGLSCRSLTHKKQRVGYGGFLVTCHILLRTLALGNVHVLLVAFIWIHLSTYLRAVLV